MQWLTRTATSCCPPIRLARPTPAPTDAKNDEKMDELTGTRDADNHNKATSVSRRENQANACTVQRSCDACQSTRCSWCAAPGGSRCDAQCRAGESAVTSCPAERNTAGDDNAAGPTVASPSDDGDSAAILIAASIGSACCCLIVVAGESVLVQRWCSAHYVAYSRRCCCCFARAGFTGGAQRRPQTCVSKNFRCVV